MSITTLASTVPTDKPRTRVTGLQIQSARRDLSDIVQRQADELAGQLGFGWQAVAAAPSTYQQLRGAVDYSLVSKKPLPVSSENSATVIYTGPEVNFAFRFWHDVSHVRHGLSFALEDELELALWHLGVLERGGLSPESLAYRLFQADIVGQLLLMGLAGRFPFDQEQFVLGCIVLGMESGVLAEIRRTPETRDA
ncbi:hypothetical protein C0Z10_08135 [Acidipropionibacterium jensenii]|uniref:Uncharacterized protein n=1 Tax=Acidipropionibacterium jensenii TaxID=1749 RepID=A0A3T0S029_9ACTN|nr:hypothetical protein [Acidipropionibacterium jensenii]AZZ39727.1 hypothetical protein C0Z10_08135 [Acidipropionibacterium jensenii]